MHKTDSTEASIYAKVRALTEGISDFSCSSGVTLNQALDVINNFQKNGSAISQNGANTSQASSSSTPTVAAATTTGSNLSSSSSSTPTVASGATTDAEKKSEMTKRLQSALLARVKTVQENKKQKSRKARFGSRTKSRN